MCVCVCVCACARARSHFGSSRDWPPRLEPHGWPHIERAMWGLSPPHRATGRGPGARAFVARAHVRVRVRSIGDGHGGLSWPGAGRAGMLVRDNAFGTTHLANSSKEGVTKFMYLGVWVFLLNAKLDYLKEQLMAYCSDCGGDKVSRRIPVSYSKLEKVDKLIVGGSIVFTFLRPAYSLWATLWWRTPSGPCLAGGF